MAKKGNFMQSLGSAFDKLGNQGDALALIEENTRETKESVAIGGDLYSRIDELTTAITDIQSGKSAGGMKDMQQALALAIVAPSMKTIGMGLQYVVDAINSLEGSGKEINEKTEALLGGLTKLGEVGASILKFAGYMLLATPLLLLLAIASPIIGIGLFLLISAVMLATRPLEDKKKLKNIERLQGVGLAILALGASLAIFFLIWPFALKGLIAASIMLLGISMVLKIIPEKALENMKAFSDTLLNFALGLGAMALVFAIIGFIAKPILNGAFVAAGMILFIAGAFYLLNKLKLIDKMEEGGKGLLFAAGAILGLAIALALFDIITPPLATLFQIALVVGAVGLTFGIMGKIFGNDIKKGAVALIFAGIAIVVLAIALKVLSLVVGSISGEDAVKSLGALLLIGLIGAAFYLAGTQGPIIALGAGAMILVGVAVIVLAAGIAILGAAMGDKGMKFVGTTLAIIGGLGVAFGVAGLAAPFIALGAGALILAGGALISIGLGLIAFGKVDYSNSGPLGFSNGQKTSPGKLARMLGFKPRPKTNLEVALEAVGDSFMLNPFKIAAMYMGAPALLMAGMALISVATGIRSFQKISDKADLPSLGTNIQAIVAGLSTTFADVGKKMGGPLWFFSDVYKGIQATRGMGKSLTGIAKGVQAMANLRFPTGFDKEGNPTGYETIDIGSVVPGLISNTQALVEGLSTVFSTIGGNPAAQGSTWFSSSTYEKGIKVVQKMGTPLFNLANGVQNMANLKFPEGYDKDGNATGYKGIGSGGLKGLIKNLGDNTKALITGLTGVFEDIGKGSAAKTSWFSSNDFEKGVEVAMQLASPYQELAKTMKTVTKITDTVADAEDVRSKVTALVETITIAGGFYNDMFENGVYVSMRVGSPYAALAAASSDVTTITSSISDAQDVRDKVSAMVQSITEVGGDVGADVLKLKTNLIWAIGFTYQKLGVAIPLIVNAIGSFAVEKGKAFASVFGGESPAELFEAKTKFLQGLTLSYVRMAVAIPMIVGSINTASAEQLDAFTSVYGGKMPTEIEALKGRENLFIAVGNAYEKMGTGTQQITSAISTADGEKLTLFKGMFMGRVSMLRPIAGYNAQTELWNAIGTNMTATATAFPQIAGAVNSMELEKLTEARGMFEALAVLAEGGESPEDILEAMGESLETALQNLADMLQEFKGAVTEQGDAQQGILSKFAAVPGQVLGGLVDGITGRDKGGGNSDDVVRAISKLGNTLTSQGIKIKKNPFD